MLTSKVQANANIDLPERCRVVGVGLKEAFSPLIQTFAGQSMRPAALARSIGIDRTLAARIVRAARSEDATGNETLKESPAPGGLRIIIDAARRAGASEAMLEPTVQATNGFERLILEFPGGRSALEATMAERDGDLRDRNERAAKQAIHRAMSSLVGYQADTVLATTIISPGRDDTSCDVTYVLGKYGVRRLRASSPITVFGFRSTPNVQNLAETQVESIDGLANPENARAYLMPDFCSRPLPPLSLFQSGSMLLYTLADSVPEVNHPVSLTAALVARNAGPRHQSGGRTFHFESHVCRLPCKVLLADVLIHDDVFSGSEPTVSSALQGIGSGERRPDMPEFQLDRIDLGLPFSPLGVGLGATETSEVPRYPQLLAQVFARRGLNPERFRGYRLRVQYPVPLVSFTVWIKLPPGPEPGSQYDI
ncbi:MAG: hypothetical protein K2W85_02455 [Phycisphaerales bacterium]|nr:hypothetical protein [Phycisphaerales bacterium]